MDPRRELLQFDLRRVELSLGALQPGGHHRVDGAGGLKRALEDVPNLLQALSDTRPQLMLQTTALGVGASRSSGGRRPVPQPGVVSGPASECSRGRSRLPRPPRR